MKQVRGYLYIATGEKYIKECENSVSSLRRYDPEAHVSLITNRKIHSQHFNEIIIMESLDDSSWKSWLNSYILGLLNSPYEKTFYLDSDTWFFDSCTELFDLLEYFDMLAALAPSDVSLPVIDSKIIKGAYPYNAGLLVFKKNKRVDRFLESWHQISTDKYGIYKTDQPAFMEAFLLNDINIYVLQSIYNFRTPSFTSALPGKIKVIHGRHKNPDKIDRIINERQSDRIWNPETRTMTFRNFKDR